MRSTDHFRSVHVAALVLCTVFLPWSTALLSMSQMLLVGNWLAEGIVRGTWRQRLRQAFAPGPALIFMSFLGLHVLGLLWTEDLGWGLDLVRILLPVLVITMVLASSPRLQVHELRTILLFGAWSVLVSTMACLLMAAPDADHRSLSRFISHIRLALLLVFAVAVFLRYFAGMPSILKAVHLVASIWAVGFILELASLQALLMFALIAAVLGWRAMAQASAIMRWSLRTLLVLLPAVVLWWLAGLWGARQALPDPSLAEQAEYTAGGERYVHDLKSGERENGRFVWTYLAWNEVGRVWARRSGRALTSDDDKGHPLYGTLARYLTSRGLRKDSVGVMALSDAEVAAIESGVPNAQQGHRGALLERVDEVLYELDKYRTEGEAGGHSVAMRLEFWRTGWAIAREHWLLGVGTGDTQRAFDRAYTAMASSLEPEWRLRAHNEYLTIWISFGVFGLAWALFSVVWPAWKLGASRDPLFVAWAIIFGVSCLTDDTVETQAGATFFALYYALLVFGAPVRDTATGPTG